MQLCVGAASRRVVEEAAKLRVAQIVASRRQVNIQGGYIGLTPRSLVDLVKNLSGGATAVVRDHGGPGQGGFDDNGVYALGIDVAAGFNALHIDVSAVVQSQQPDVLVDLMRVFHGRLPIEIGGEHDNLAQLNCLFHATIDAGYDPSVVVIPTGMHVWADRQQGMPRHAAKVGATCDYFFRLGISTKMHNADWYGGLKRYANAVDYCNIAPEFGAVEVDAFLLTCDKDLAIRLLGKGYALQAWRRWFNDDEGTWLERAKCGLRYILSGSEFEVTDEAEHFIRERIRDAIVERSEACARG